MEYEIKDDPQGLPDIPDGDRDGGLEEDPVALRRAARHQERDGEETNFVQAPS